VTNHVINVITFRTEAPLLWIEILSHDDSMAEVWQRANELVALGVPYVWIIEPNTLESELRSAAGTVHLADKVLRLPDHGIVIPLIEVMHGLSAKP
jgi:Uma2 family endonuclease